MNSIKLFKNLFLSYDGRINRQLFLFSNIILNSLMYEFSSLLTIWGIKNNLELDKLIVFSSYMNMFLGAVFAYPIFCLGSKRLHDLNKKNTLIWISLIFSFISFYFIESKLAAVLIVLYLTLFKGQKGSNKYGEDPLLNNEYKQIKKTLIVLLIPFLILGIGLKLTEKRMIQSYAYDQINSLISNIKPSK